MSEIIKVEQAEMLQAINKSEIDVQISTAKMYPRDVNKALDTMVAIATIDEETAGDCHYALKRDGNIIEGLSVRMAEIIADCWGNLRVQTRIVGNDGKTITAQGVCHDLETNVAVLVEVKRRITTKTGATFSEDMQVMVGNAASAIAFRNAVLKVVPKAVTKNVCNLVYQKAKGKAIEVPVAWQKCRGTFAKVGVDEPMLLWYLQISNAEELTSEHISLLRGTYNSLHEGTTTVMDCFINPYREAQKSKEVSQEHKNNKDFIAQAMAESKA